MLPKQVITPSAGASLPSIPRCEKCGRPWMPSSVNSPPSKSRSSRSLAVSLSCSCWRSILSPPPPSFARARRSWRSSTRERSGGRALELVLGQPEAGHLQAYELGLVRNGLEEIEQLLGSESAGGRVLDGE